MAITYSEFDTTPAGLIAAIKAVILSNTHWAELPVTEYTSTSAGATTAAGSTVTLASAAGFVAGSTITAGAGTANESVRVIASVAGNVVTITTTWGFIHASGATFKTRDSVLKSTASNGAELILNLEGEATALNYFGVTVHSAWTGTDPGGYTDRDPLFLYHKASSTGSTSTTPLHATVSVGQDHLFIAVEGPRPHETGASSVNYGSVKNYIALSTIVSYHAADTVKPVIAIGQTVTGINGASVSYNCHQVEISRESTGTTAWTSGRLATLTFPTIYSTDVISVNRACSIDAKNYLLPYVLFSENEGIRGRLTSFFYANTNVPSPITDYPDPVGTRVTHEGIVYKLVAANKGDGSQAAWGPFGSANNGSSSSNRTVIVAVPFADA